MRIFVLLSLSLVLFAVGCGDKKVSLEKHEGLVYIEGSDTPYTGKNSIFYGNGHKHVEGNYKDGKLDSSLEWYENGQKKSEMNYKDGKLDGLQLKWYENGQKEREGNFKDGKLVGLQLDWHSNGQKQSEFLFKNGKEDGLQLKWHENGQKQFEGNYKDGEIVEGSQKYWNSEGEPVDSWEETVAE